MKAGQLAIFSLIGLVATWAGLPSAAGQTDVCSLPKDAGPCDAAHPRWCYNWAGRRCEKFTYGGCGGNGNNFRTLEECQGSCGHHGLPSGAAGECPTIHGSGPCVDYCGSDDTCGPGQKCCSNGCGHTCMEVTQGTRRPPATGATRHLFLTGVGLEGRWLSALGPMVEK
ncbi:chelonianin-like [Anolis sagrei]|uniref:chelonianin-like n=1 Tax=Anolis sagrei TaxID=38937 RepID=UPI003521EFC1